MAWSRRRKTGVLIAGGLVALCMGNLLYVPRRESTQLGEWHSGIRAGMTAHEVYLKCPGALRMTVDGVPVESPAAASPNSHWAISVYTRANGEEQLHLQFGPDAKVSRKEYLMGIGLNVRRWLNRTFGW